VTGFGLLGHLIEMIQYEDAGIAQDLHSGEANGADSDAPGLKEENAVELCLEKIPTLFGAEECILAGIVSSLQPQVGIYYRLRRHSQRVSRSYELPTKCSKLRRCAAVCAECALRARGGEC
jgi:hypothetical protein